MKTILSQFNGLGLVIVAFLLNAETLRGEVLVVDRNLSNDAADYHSLPEAYGAAAEGDTIYIMPADHVYELESVDKTISIIGSGYGKEVFYPESTGVDSKLGPVSINATNVFISGMVFSRPVDVVEGSEGVTLFRNLFLANFNTRSSDDTDLSRISELYVINNWFDLRQGTADARDIQLWTEISNFIFANNVVIDANFRFARGDGRLFHNIFLGPYLNFGNVQQREIRSSGHFFNNIVHLTRGAGINNYLRGDVEFSNNILKFSDEPPNLDDVFVNTGAWGHRYVLAPNSPAKGAGLNGEDLGIFAGKYAWKLNQQPPIPIISGLDAPSIVGPGESLKISVTIEPNN